VLRIDRSKGQRTASDLEPLGDSQLMDVVDVGRGPVALALDPTGRQLATANAYSDTVTLVDTRRLEVEATIALGDQPPRPTAAQRGEALFHEGALAMDRWMSCASCHPRGHTTGQNFDTLGDGHHGAAKNTPSLLGVAGTAPHGWTGRFGRLEEQVERSIRSSLQGGEPSRGDVADLVAYLESLHPIEPGGAELAAAGGRGEAQFRVRRCATCHEPPLFTQPATRDVGLVDAKGTRRFNPPALRGVAHSAPYLHDGSATSLEEVLTRHHPGFPAPPDREERRALEAYLKGL
jgi:YVTN family beta-propeller protein